jgi:hypothetical protein
VLALPNQGRNHFDDRVSADRMLHAILLNNTPDQLARSYGDVHKMKVIPTICYDHGDADGHRILEHGEGW